MGTAPDQPPYMPMPAPTGKAATPQKHEHEQAPLFIAPDPVAMDPPASAGGPTALTGAGEAGAAGGEAAGGAE